MRRRRRSKRYINSRFARGAVITVLLLWVGLLLFGILNYDRPQAGAKTEAVASVSGTQRQPGNRKLDKAPARPDNDPAAPPSDREAPVRVRTIDTRDAITPVGSNAPPPPPGLSNVAAERASGALATSRRKPEASDSSEQPDSVSDMARLETASDDAVELPSAAVARAQFTSGIEEREPINSINSVFSTNGKVFSLDGWPLPALYYFTEITDASGGTVTHRWEYNGRVMARTSFDIGANRWRVYSRTDLPSGMPGSWRVIVTDARGNVLESDTLLYQAD